MGRGGPGWREGGQAGCYNAQLVTLSSRTSTSGSGAAAVVQGGCGSGWLPTLEVGVRAHGNRLGECQALGPLLRGQKEVRPGSWHIPQCFPFLQNGLFLLSSLLLSNMDFGV